MSVKIDISNRTIFRILAITVLFIVLVKFIVATQTALILIFIAFFFALALNPSVTYLSDKLPGKKRGVASVLVYILILSVLIGLISSLVPPIVRQTNQLINELPGYIEEVRNMGGFVGDMVQRFDLPTDTDDLGGDILKNAVGAGEPVFNFLTRISTSLVSILTVIVLTLFMLIEGPRWVDKFWRIQPEKTRRHRQELAEKMYHVVTGYVNGQLAIATLSGVATFIALVILGVPFALSLAGMVALFGLIPVIGTTLGGIIIITAGLFQSVTIGIILAVFYIIYQQIENNIIQPAIQSKSLGMSPLLILVSVIIGINLAGILGGLLAIPIAGCLRILAVDYVEQHHIA